MLPYLPPDGQQATPVKTTSTRNRLYERLSMP
jgi:hypothetical protein